MERTQLFELVSKINERKNANYRAYCNANGIKFLNKFCIMGKEEMEQEAINSKRPEIYEGIDDIIAKYDLPNRIKELARERVGVISLQHLTDMVVNEIMNVYFNERNKARFDFARACQEITSLLRNEFINNYYQYANHIYSYTREELNGVVGQIAKDKMAKINEIFKKNDIKSLKEKAYIIEQVYGDVIFNGDTARSMYDNYVKYVEV